MDNKKSQIDTSDRGGRIGPANPTTARPIFILHSETDHRNQGLTWASSIL